MALPVTDTVWSRHCEVPFDAKADIPEQGWLARLLHLPDTRAASAIVERALSRLAPNVPSANDVAGIYAYHRVSPARARRLSAVLWLRMLHSCLGDDVIAEAEERYLDALRIAFGLRDRDVDALWEGEASAAARAALEATLGDGRLTDAEWRRMAAIARGPCQRAADSPVRSSPRSAN